MTAHTYRSSKPNEDSALPSAALAPSGLSLEAGSQAEQPAANADELGERCAAAITPALFEPAIKKVADELYMTLMESVQDYLCENVEGNIASTISSARREAARLNLEMWEIDKALGGASWQGTRAERIATLEANNNRYHTLLYAVASKFPGEERHETALRYIREREAGNGNTASATGAA